MEYTKRKFVYVFVGVSLCLTASSAEPEASEDLQGVASRIQQLKDANDAPTLCFGIYPELFRAAGVAGLSRLQIAADDSIAVQSAWQELELTVPIDRAESDYRPSVDKLNWFLGFSVGGLA